MLLFLGCLHLPWLWPILINQIKVSTLSSPFQLQCVLEIIQVSAVPIFYQSLNALCGC